MSRPPSPDVPSPDSFVYQNIEAILPQVKKWCHYLHKGNKEAGNELHQRTILKALKYANTFQQGDIGCLRAWVFTVAKSERNSWHRLAMHREQPTLLEDSTVFETGVEGSAEHSVELRQTLEAIGRLKPHHQRVFVALMNGESYIDIAHREGVSEGTIKSRINRARMKLKEALSDL